MRSEGSNRRFRPFYYDAAPDEEPPVSREPGVEYADDRPVESMVYFFAADEFNAVKIGYTELPILKKLSLAQTYCPVVLRVMGIIPGGTRETEATLHARFAKDRIRRPGEWFRLSEDIIRYIKANSEAVVNLEPIPEDADVNPKSSARVRYTVRLLPPRGVAVYGFGSRAEVDQAIDVGMVAMLDAGYSMMNVAQVYRVTRPFLRKRLAALGHPATKEPWRR